MAASHGVLVVDFGAQYAQLIARRVREAKVYSEIVPSSITAAEVSAKNPEAIILSGGPSSVYADHAPKVDPAIFSLGIPVFGICYGFQLLSQALGGTGHGSAADRCFSRRGFDLQIECQPSGPAPVGQLIEPQKPQPGVCAAVPAASVQALQVTPSLIGGLTLSIGGARQMQIVQQKRHAIGAELHIALKHGKAQVGTVLESRQGVFRGQGARAPVGNPKRVGPGWGGKRRVHAQALSALGAFWIARGQFFPMGLAPQGYAPLRYHSGLKYECTHLTAATAVHGRQQPQVARNPLQLHVVLGP